MEPPEWLEKYPELKKYHLGNGKFNCGDLNNYHKLYTYFKKNGTSLVIDKESSLYKFIEDCREKYEDAVINPKLKVMLDDIEFDWRIKSIRKYKEKKRKLNKGMCLESAFRLLEAHKECYGSLSIVRDNICVRRMRKRWIDGKLTNAQVYRLVQMDFPWEGSIPDGRRLRKRRRVTNTRPILYAPPEDLGDISD